MIFEIHCSQGLKTFIDPDRIPKSLYTDNVEGIPVSFLRASTSELEAETVAQEIERLVKYSKGLLTYKDIAVLVRINFMTRSIEQSLNALHIPYVVVCTCIRLIIFVETHGGSLGRRCPVFWQKRSERYHCVRTIFLQSMRHSSVRSNYQRTATRHWRIYVRKDTEAKPRWSFGHYNGAG